MPDTGSFADRHSAAKDLLSGSIRPRILITGACQGTGRACAEVLAARGAELILVDKDGSSLTELAENLGAAGHFFCDVASEDSVAVFAARVLDQFSTLDIVINAAGGGYARTLGMYRVSRSFLPALSHGSQKLLVNISPAPDEADSPIFPYASSRHAFHRLSSALAYEARATSIVVLSACPSMRRISEVIPDPNAGSWMENCEMRRPTQQDIVALAWQVAGLTRLHGVPRRRAG